MTAHRDLKKLIRDRKARTGESYTAARAHVMRQRATLLGLPDEMPSSEPAPPVDAAVLKVNQQSARVRILGEDGQVTFRSGDAWQVVPGHLVTLSVERRWTWKGDAYASGRIENARIDVTRLGLECASVGKTCERGEAGPGERESPAHATASSNPTMKTRDWRRTNLTGCFARS